MSTTQAAAQDNKTLYAFVQADDDTMAFVQTVHVEHARDSSKSYKKYDLFEAKDVDHSKAFFRGFF